MHLRLCRTCGHVGCCDSSPNTHATKHFHATQHPIIEGYDPPEGWGWCFVDEVLVRPVGSRDAAAGTDSALRVSPPQSVFLVAACVKHCSPIVTVRRVLAAVSFAAAAVNQRFGLHRELEHPGLLRVQALQLHLL